MTCAACKCNSCKRKAAAPTVHSEAPRRRNYTRYFDEVILVIVGAAITFFAIKFVALPTINTSSEIELRLEHLEKQHAKKN
jgi:hypothetical protein